jgi:VanZ family protein
LSPTISPEGREQPSPVHRLRRRLARAHPALLATAWTVIILVICLTPRLLPPNTSGEVPIYVRLHFDKFIHIFLFYVYGFLWMRVGRSPYRAAWVLAGGVALAILTEWLQALPQIGRSTDLLDGLADALGVVIGIWVFVRLSRS